MKKKVDTEKQITSWASGLASKNETNVQEKLILSSYIQNIENHVYFPKAMISLEKNYETKIIFAPYQNKSISFILKLLK